MTMAMKREMHERGLRAASKVLRGWPWPADVDYQEATARQYDEDKTEANRNAFLWASLRLDPLTPPHSHPTAPPRITRR